MKLQFCLKVAGGEHEALNQMLLDTDYSDAGQIPASAKPYVAYATKKRLCKEPESKFEPLLQVFVHKWQP